jgi:hypothetical protein
MTVVTRTFLGFRGRVLETLEGSGYIFISVRTSGVQEIFLFFPDLRIIFLNVRFYDSIAGS